MMTALDAIRAAGLKTKSNIRFAFEGEEEAGSVNLAKILASNKDLFSGDLWLVCDGPLHQTRRQSIVFGARGISTVDITVYGPRGELHSGHYGNWAPNPAMMLVQLLASMKDASGRVLVDHFYDGIEPLSETGDARREGRSECGHRVDARVLVGLNGERSENAGRADHAALAQHSRHGELAHRQSGVERHTGNGHGHRRHAPGERAWILASRRIDSAH